MAQRTTTNDEETQTTADAMKVMDIECFEEIIVYIQEINSKLQTKFHRYMSDESGDDEIVMILSEIISDEFPDYNSDYDHLMNEDDIRPYSTTHKNIYDSNGDKAFCTMYEFPIRYNNVEFILSIPVQTITMCMIPFRNGTNHYDEKAKMVNIYNIGYPAITGLTL